ncbi:MAG: glycosyltransferase family 4 protein [Candidatus Eremiobacteraeota bacterium]|nr:glycosyltransferase family 4 protein [Candidatus Eremiobacteraeota bacterium]
MKVALDAQLTVGTATGIGEYVRGLADALRVRGLDVAELRQPSLDPWRFDRRVVWDQFLLPKRARDSQAALLHCAAGTMPRFAGLPIVVTVHDLAWHEAQAHAPPYARYYFGRFSLRQYRRAARIIVDSAFSRDELLRLTNDLDPQRIVVVYPGVAADFCNLKRTTGDGRTILVVGTIERRKNLEVLVRALPRLTGTQLVAIGPQTEYARECAELARRLQVADRVEMPGYIPRADLLELYRRSAVAAVPSRYEGFGYAAAQALCAGVPCVVSNSSSLPEVAGMDARVVDAVDADAWAEALAPALRGDDDARAAAARDRAIARFAWATSAGQIESVYVSVNR